MISVSDIARSLLDARAGGAGPASAHWPLRERADAYAVQDAALAVLGPIGGWKVGAGGLAVEPHCAPLPARGIMNTGVVIPALRYRARLLELEVALRVGTDLHVVHDLPTPSELAQHFDAVLPAIEVVESRLAEGQAAQPLAKLADLQSHGALVVGAPSAIAPSDVDLRTVQAMLWFDADCVARTVGGNPAQEVWRLLGWLARHCTERGVPLTRGQIVTTGSCTGLLPAPADRPVRGEIAGIGVVELCHSAKATI